MINRIDINADLGEGFPYDAELMALISSCNIACGGHYGNKETMRQAIRLAKDFGVKVGAHPSYPDTMNFGRKKLAMTTSDLTKSILDQILQFYEICDSEQIEVNHVKLHGALYNCASSDPAIADAILNSIVQVKPVSNLYAPFGSILAKKAANLFSVVYEAFIDRRYNDDLSLVKRIESNALIKEPKEAYNQFINIFEKGVVVSISNHEVPIEAQTFCIHGDHENSIEILKYIHTHLRAKSITIA